MNRTAVATMILLAVLSLGAARPLPAQEPVPGTKGVATRRAVINFMDLARREALAPPKPEKPVVVPFMPMPGDRPVPAGVIEDTELPLEATALPTALAPAGATASPLPTASFEALGDSRINIPPDTMGAAGPNHLMVTLNSAVSIQDKTGGVLSSVTLNSFWSSTGATGVFDPKIAYDPFGNRWIFTALSNSKSAESSLLVSVTETSDPTGNWFLFRIDVDVTDTDWGDFPYVGFNKDWVVITLNFFAVADNMFSKGVIYVFDKATLYGGLTAPFTSFDGVAGSFSPARTYDNTLATMYMVQAWNGNFGGNGSLRLSTITGMVGAEAFTEETKFVFTPNPWADFPPGGTDFAPQLGTTDKFQINDSRLEIVTYRNGSLWTSQTVFLPAVTPTRSAAQWWQFLPDATVQQFGRVDDSSGVMFYAFASLAVNSRNDVLLGYSSFSANQFASIAYSFRLGTDPASTMREDVLLKRGENVYFKTFTGTANRWGDYSSTVVDPANDLDFWTIQEYASSPNFGNGDNRWGTWWGKVVPTVPDDFQLSASVTVNDNAAASPYPSDITISGLTGVVARVVVELNDFAHTVPDDVDILLVGPTGASAIILSDVGGATSVIGLDLILDGGAASSLPDAGPLQSGVFQPTNIGAGDTFPGPAPVPSGAVSLATFIGTDPNGTWSLYIVGDTAGSTGTVAGGWTLEIFTTDAIVKKRRGQITSE